MAKLKLEASKVTPRQALMIGVLALLLLAALYWPTDEEALDAGAIDTEPPPRGAVAARMAAARAQAAPKAKDWPLIELDAAICHDPFDSPLLRARQSAPEIVPEQPPAQPEQTADLLALRQDGVSMILRDASGMVAISGGRKLRVGDVIGGYRVAAIEMNGVLLERVKAD